MKRERYRVRASTLVLLVASLVGAAGFLYPFLLPASVEQTGSAQAGEMVAPLLFAAMTALCLLVMMVTVSDDMAGVGRSKILALLGVLVAIDATVRIVPSVLGASPIFFLIIVVGAVFGSAIGFQMGTLTLLLSAFVTGGVGPWLPYQMLGAGWIGLTAGWLPRRGTVRRRVATMAVFGAVWGIVFGALMNLWFWPFTAPGSGAESALYWSPGLGMGETMERYARFYVVTSLGFDFFRVAGNVALTVVLGAPVLRLLERYRRRFTWEPWHPVADEDPDIHPVRQG